MDKETIKLPLRTFLFLFGLSTQILLQFLRCDEQSWALTCFARNKYLSNQANYLVVIWLLLWILWRNDDERVKKLEGKIRGAVTVYILIVWLAYWALLSGGDDPQGIDIYTNIVIHYAVPILFLIDWLLYERVKYEWSFFKLWIIYPTLYAVFAITNGLLELELGYIYGFLNPEPNGWGMVFIMILAIYVLFFVLGTILMLVNQRVFNTNQ